MPDYGLDMSCDTDLDPLLADVSADLLMQQVCVRRLFTRKGSLISAPSANTIDVRDFLSGGILNASTTVIQAQCQSALLDDERIATANVVARFDSTTRVLDLQINGTGAAGPFSLTLAITSVTVQVIFPV